MKHANVEKFMFAAIFVLILIAGCSNNGKTQAAQTAVITGSAGAALKEFNVAAFRFGYSPDFLEINKGDRVRITIDNTDTMHGIRIPDLNIRGNNSIEFTANTSGEFIWYCNVMCGEKHKEMQGKLIVK